MEGRKGEIKAKAGGKEEIQLRRMGGSKDKRKREKEEGGKKEGEGMKVKDGRKEGGGTKEGRWRKEGRWGKEGR